LTHYAALRYNIPAAEDGRPDGGRSAEEEQDMMRSQELTSQIRKFPNELLGSARKVWLASLGTVALAEEEGARLFERLVDRGRSLESQGREQLAKVRSQAEAQLDEAQAALDTQVAKAVERLGIPHRRQISALTERVEKLTRAVEAVQQGQPIAPTVLHLLPQDEGWRIEAEGEALLSTHATKDEALAAGREAASRQQPSKLVVHRLDGTVQMTYSYD
jgi:poly(hydroxyalkanoate) granule-associated protein